MSILSVEILMHTRGYTNRKKRQLQCTKRLSSACVTVKIRIQMMIDTSVQNSSITSRDHTWFFESFVAVLHVTDLFGIDDVFVDS